MNQDEKEFLEALVARLEINLTNAIKESEKHIMQTQQDLDAAIAALPGQIETQAEAALAPVIAAIEAKVTGTPVDLTAEIASLNAIAGTVSTAIATAVTPPAAGTAATPARAPGEVTSTPGVQA